MKLLYPAMITFLDSTNSYHITFPNLPGCEAEGVDLAQTMLDAADAAAEWLLIHLEKGRPLPLPNGLCGGEMLNTMVIDLDAYTERFGQQAVRKTLTIPAYMNTYIRKNNLSLSQIAQEAISRLMQNQA